MARILIVEDEADIAMGLEEDLTRHEHVVEIARDGDVALRRGRDGAWDLIVLDIMLPYRDGLDVCRELRRTGIRTPVIMLSARSQEAQKILGLEVGADDYMTKPFSPAELRTIGSISAIRRQHNRRSQTQSAYTRPLTHGADQLCSTDPPHRTRR